MPASPLKLESTLAKGEVIGGHPKNFAHPSFREILVALQIILRPRREVDMLCQNEAVIPPWKERAATIDPSRFFEPLGLCGVRVRKIQISKLQFKIETRFKKTGIILSKILDFGISF
jgi:hypothetical protein